MAHEKRAIPDDLLELSQRLEEWRGARPPRTRLPEPIWEAAVEMAQRHRLYRTIKALRMDYMALKKRLPASAPPVPPAPPAFLELVTPAAAVPMECVVELESACGRMRVTTKGEALDWASLLHAWREAAR